jgi:hypothetical protein
MNPSLPCSVSLSKFKAGSPVRLLVGWGLAGVFKGRLGAGGGSARLPVACLLDSSFAFLAHCQLMQTFAPTALRHAWSPGDEALCMPDGRISLTHGSFFSESNSYFVRYLCLPLSSWGSLSRWLERQCFQRSTFERKIFLFLSGQRIHAQDGGLLL